MFVCQDLLVEVRNNQNFLLRVVTGIETWVYWYGTETKQQSFQWKLVMSMSKEGKARQVKHQEHVDFEGIVHQKFVPPGKTVNHHLYQEVL